MEMKQSSKRYLWLFALLILGAATMACAALQGSQAAVSEEETPSERISVTGYGEATGVPDIATINLGVEVRAGSIIEGIEQSNQAMESLQAALKDMGIAAEDLQSTNFSVWREEEFDRMTGMPTGENIYHVDSSLMVKVRDINRVSEVIETGLAAGANNVFGLTFGIDDTAELEAQARRIALADAADRAGQLASELGFTLGNPVIVSELAGGAIPFSLEAAYGFGIGGGGGGPPLQPGELTVRIQVDVAYDVAR